jgi:peptidoglycan/xylan/chitin deacetylase (PgdA/CDA1 family)
VVLGLAGGVLAAAASLLAGDLVGSELGQGRSPRPTPTPGAAGRPVPSRLPLATAFPLRFSAPLLTPVALPHGAITGLPGLGRSIALTVDDGVNTEVVRRYTEFARATGMRLTFFINGFRPSWTDNARALRPLVDSGQVQIANHTWSHPNLTKLSDAAISAELGRNHDFIRSMYGVDARPFYRPPYGFHNPRVDAAAANLGYTTPVLWYGTLSDSGLISTAQLQSFADKWMLAQHIVIGHANYPTVTDCFDYLAHLIRVRDLQPVTLNDYFAR